MSATRFKIWDKVRVRRDLVCENYDDIFANYKMTKLAGETLTVRVLGDDFYGVRENDWAWNDEMLEPAGKTLDTLCRGDTVYDHDNEARKVLAVIDGCYLLSSADDVEAASGWYTPAELKKLGHHCAKYDQKPTIEIDGERYYADDIVQAIKNLGPVE
jgi:hypothetical protein